MSETKFTSTLEWLDAGDAAPRDVDLLLIDTDGNIRQGRHIGGGLYRSDLDFGDYSATFYYPKDNRPTLYALMPALPARARGASQ